MKRTRAERASALDSENGDSGDSDSGSEDRAEGLYSRAVLNEPLPGDPGFLSPERDLAKQKRKEVAREHAKLVQQVKRGEIEVDVASLKPRRSYALSDRGRASIALSNQKRKNRKGGGGARRDQQKVKAILKLLVGCGEME